MRRLDWKKALFYIYLAVVYLITVIRPWQPGVGFFRGGVNFSLFKEYIPFIRSGSWYTFIYLFVGNIVWFVPLGIFFGIFDEDRGRKLSKGLLPAVIKGLCLSLSIEVLQFIFGKGLAEIDDLILNTFGVALGYCLISLLLKIIKQRKQGGKTA